MKEREKIKWQAWYIRLTHWEYWSFNAVYMPIIWYWAFLAIRARSFYFFNACNPSIKYGGFLMESKWDIHPLLPPKYTPQTVLIKKTDNTTDVLANAASFCFPVICKPDIGSRGRGVAIIHNEKELLQYQQQCPINFLIQEKVNYPLEAGIFYVRMPGEEKGRITGIVEKEFLKIKGDGRSTVRQLVINNDRYLLQLDQLEKLVGAGIDEVLKKDEERILVPFGNHARGCRFLNSPHRITSKLNDTIDAFCKQIDGFYFGRLDIRFESWELLEYGEFFSIIELNGSGSEPTHIYGMYSVFAAWKEIIKHWRWLCNISIANHRKGIPYLGYAETKKMFNDSKACDKLLQPFQFDPTLTEQNIPETLTV